MNKRIRIIVISTLTMSMFLTGIMIAFHQNLNARQAVFREHDHHLVDLAEGADHNIQSAFELCELEIESAIKREAVRQAESLFASTGNSQKLKFIIREATLLSADYVNRIVVEKDGKLVISSVDSDPLNYYRIDETGSNENDISKNGINETGSNHSDASDKFRIYREPESGDEFLAISIKSPEYGLTYWVFLNIEIMYSRLVADSLYADYWTVFYDESSGLVIYNNDEVPSHMILSKEAMKSRNDGLSLLLRFEEEGTSQIKSYIFEDADGNALNSRISIIPSSLSENGEFAVAVAVFDGEKIKAMQGVLLKTIIGTFLISVSVSIAIYFLMSIKKREKKLAKEIELLEKESELTNELLKQQEKLIHHQKLETIGVMTSGIAHEFNNMLAPIMSNSLLLLEKVPEESELFNNGLEIYQTSMRAKELVSNISKLSRKSSASAMHIIYPDELIASVTSLTKTSAGANIEIKTDVRTEKTIFGDESQLSYMLINLCINAVQEMTPSGGILTISSWDDGEFVYFSVSDTGKGIPENVFPNLFNPFFTTKEAGKGTGLGLAIALHTATDHGGNIIAENLPEGGAKFTVSIPVMQR